MYMYYYVVVEYIKIVVLLLVVTKGLYTSQIIYSIDKNQSKNNLPKFGDKKMREVKYTTSKKIVCPKLFGKPLFCNISHETKKAYLLVDVVQDTSIYGNNEKGLMLSQRWMAKSQIETIKDVSKTWSYEYLHLFGGKPAGQRNHREVY